jgi:hypothetical protein
MFKRQVRFIKELILKSRDTPVGVKRGGGCTPVGVDAREGVAR